MCDYLFLFILSGVLCVAYLFWNNFIYYFFFLIFHVCHIFKVLYTIHYSSKLFLRCKTFIYFTFRVFDTIFFFLLMSIFIKSILQIFPYLLFGIYLYSRYGSNRPIKSIHADRSVAGETSCMQFGVCCFFYFYTCIFIETYFCPFVWCAWPLPIWQLFLKASTFCMKSKSCSL